MKQTNAKGFISAEVKALPKGIMVLADGIKDGTYLLALDHVIPYTRYGNGIESASKDRRTIKAGTVLISTENGHFYRFNENGDGFSGLSKRNSVLTGALVQRISITAIEIDTYVAPPKKKVPKKKTKSVPTARLTALKKKSLRVS